MLIIVEVGCLQMGFIGLFFSSLSMLRSSIIYRCPSKILPVQLHSRKVNTDRKLVTCVSFCFTVYMKVMFALHSIKCAIA